jgi:hypothetical protein
MPRRATLRQVDNLETIEWRIRAKEGSWPAECVQRAFVEGAKWWEFQSRDATMWPSDRDRAEAEAVRRYGDPLRNTGEPPPEQDAMSDDPIRTLARQTEQRIDAIVSQFSGIGSDVDVMRAEVVAEIEAALRQVQRETREAILGGIVVTCRACKLHYSLRETLESDGVCKHCGKLPVQIAAKWTR